MNDETERGILRVVLSPERERCWNSSIGLGDWLRLVGPGIAVAFALVTVMAMVTVGRPP